VHLSDPAAHACTRFGSAQHFDAQPQRGRLRFELVVILVVAGDVDTIDSELRLLAAVRRSIREHGGEPSSRHVDELLDERNELTGS
jgi:hypothetical protein